MASYEIDSCLEGVFGRIGELLGNYWGTIGEPLGNHWGTIGEPLGNHWGTASQQGVGRRGPSARNKALKDPGDQHEDRRDDDGDDQEGGNAGKRQFDQQPNEAEKLDVNVIDDDWLNLFC